MVRKKKINIERSDKTDAEEQIVLFLIFSFIEHI